MLTIAETELTLRFPEVHTGIMLRIFFHRAGAGEERVRLRQVDGGVRLDLDGRVVMHLRPEITKEYRGQKVQTFYPCAALVTVGGRSAITGMIANSLIRMPQNYFATPPQGGIDGYFLDGEVHPFLAGAESAQHRKRLDIKVFPMKREAYDEYQHRRYLIGAGNDHISGLTLKHGGDRHCEPIYEDLCSLGDWDRNCVTSAVVWLDSGK